MLRVNRNLEADTSEPGVGVLGWLGFIILNVAAWGIIGTATAMVWAFGFAVCLAYTGGLAALAVTLDRRDPVKNRQFVNLLWVLVATFVFVLGTLIAVQVVGPLVGEGEGDDHGSSGADSEETGGNSSVPAPRVDYDSLPDLLPGTASEELQAWARADQWQESRNYAGFHGSLFFMGKRGTNNDEQVLLRAVGSRVSSMTPPSLRGVGWFAQFRDQLFFLSTGGFWRVDPADLGTAVHVLSVEVSESGQRQHLSFMQLFVDAASSRLYLKSSYTCGELGCWNTVWTVISSDGTSAGMTDLRSGNTCADLGPCTSANRSHYSGSREPPRAVLWGMLFLAVLPMMALAGYILVAKEMPGLIANLFVGSIIAVALLLGIGEGVSSTDFFGSFMKCFLTAFTSLLWVVLLRWSLVSPSVDGWLGELRTWAVTLVAVTFALVIHVDLEIPLTGDSSSWALYALLAVLQILFSVVVAQTVPMFFGAMGLFFLAAKVSYKLGELVGPDGGQLLTIGQLAVFALQGVAIIAAAVFYAGNSSWIQGVVRAAFMCDPKAYGRLGPLASETPSASVGVPGDGM